VSDRVNVRLRDYREADGEYDAIVSVEMIEAVGEAYWATCFATLDRPLAPGGKLSTQAITMAHDRFLATRRSFSWIQKYIFPGGIIPSLQSIDDSLAARSTLRVTKRRELWPHYARTLHVWVAERFIDQDCRRPSSPTSPLDAVFDCLSDFTTTTEWDPGTQHQGLKALCAVTWGLVVGWCVRRVVAWYRKRLLVRDQMSDVCL
jgi:hypothetical protein